MNAFIFVWNPKRWTWGDIEQSIDQIDKSGKCSRRWSCGNTKYIKPGDRIFLVKVGTEPRGIIAAGFATTTPFADRHWSGENKEAFYVDIDFEVLLNPDEDPILTLDIIRIGKLETQNWTPQSSGISIKSELIDELEAVWFDFLTTQNIRHNPFIPADNEIQRVYTEGTPNQVLVTKYERNPFARKKCLEYHGFSCSVCDFNFQQVYGDIGKDFIHVHHLAQVANIGKTYDIDPINDLRPVCPNCHSIIHKRKTAFTLDEVKKFIKQSS